MTGALCLAGERALAAVTSTDTTNPNVFMGKVGIGTNAPSVGLDVAGAFRAGSSSSVTACSGTTEGSQRYNYTSHAMEFCNGTSWMQLTQMVAGAVANVTASGPPVGANIYNATISGNYTPAFGSFSNIINGSWPANGISATSNASCLSLYDTTTSPAQSVVLDLGSTKTINTIYASIPGGNSSAMNVNFAFSNDGTNYTSSTVLQISTGSYSLVYFASAALSPNVSARYVRLSNGGNAGSGFYDNDTICQVAVGP